MIEKEQRRATFHSHSRSTSTIVAQELFHLVVMKYLRRRDLPRQQEEEITKLAKANSVRVWGRSQKCHEICERRGRQGYPCARSQRGGFSFFSHSPAMRKAN